MIHFLNFILQQIIFLINFMCINYLNIYYVKFKKITFYHENLIIKFNTTIFF